MRYLRAPRIGGGNPRKSTKQKRSMNNFKLSTLAKAGEKRHTPPRPGLLLVPRVFRCFAISRLGGRGGWRLAWLLWRRR
jgi:hypothetical protein